jgi:hypothetical protein
VKQLTLVLVLLAGVAFWTHQAFAQRTAEEIQAYCQRAKNTEASGKDNLYPAQFPTMWRCMNGSVYICEIGASGRGCMKAGHSLAPTEGVRTWCRQNPNSDFVPGAYLSSAAITWRCQGTRPVVVETEGVDERGYV